MNAPEVYAEAAVVARFAAEGLLSRLQWMTIEPKVILVLGAGAWSVALQQRYPAARLLTVDRAETLLLHTRYQLQSALTVCADGVMLPLLLQSVDLIVANFFLPWQAEVKAVMAEWVRVLRPEGVLILTALGVDTLHVLRPMLQSEHMPRCVDMHDIGDALIQAGFADPVLDVDYCHVLYRDAMRLRNDLLTTGMWLPPSAAVNLDLPPPAADGKWQLTYEVIYAHAFGQAVKNEFSAAEDGVVRIPLAHLRRK